MRWDTLQDIHIDQEIREFAKQIRKTEIKFQEYFGTIQEYADTQCTVNKEFKKSMTLQKKVLDFRSKMLIVPYWFYKEAATKFFVSTIVSTQATHDWRHV